MLICSSFSDKRTRTQGLMRICRYKDKGEYIQNDQVPDIDREKFIDHKSKMTKAEAEIKKLILKQKKPAPLIKSKTQIEEEKKDYRTRLNEDQIKQMQGQPTDPKT